MPSALQTIRTALNYFACVVVLAGGSGCNVWKLQRELQLNDKLAFSEYHDLKQTLRRNRKLARSEYERYSRCFPSRRCSEDFEAGFLDGYVDHLTYGGEGTPPIAPPRKIWRDRNRHAANEWFHGFSTGSGIAIQSGRREENTLPVSFRPSPENIHMQPESTAEQVTQSLSEASSLGLPTVTNHNFAATLIEAPSMQVPANLDAGTSILPPTQEMPSAPVYP